MFDDFIIGPQGEELHSSFYDIEWSDEIKQLLFFIPDAE